MLCALLASIASAHAHDVVRRRPYLHAGRMNCPSQWSTRPARGMSFARSLDRASGIIMHLHAAVLLLLFAAASSPVIAGNAHTVAKAQHEGTDTETARAARTDAAVEQMMRADVDKNGTLSRDEVYRLDRRMSQKFDAADGNRDGRLTLREFERLRALSSGATSGESARGSTAGSGPGTRR
jgi:hypothetical protein